MKEETEGKADDGDTTEVGEAEGEEVKEETEAKAEDGDTPNVGEAEGEEVKEDSKAKADDREQPPDLLQMVVDAAFVKDEPTLARSLSKSVGDTTYRISRKKEKHGVYLVIICVNGRQKYQIREDMEGALAFSLGLFRRLGTSDLNPDELYGVRDLWLKELRWGWGCSAFNSCLRCCHASAFT